MAVIAPLLLMAACLGYGLAILRALKLDTALPAGEVPAWAWAAGYGLLGSLLFPMALLGWVQAPVQALFLCLGLPGLFLLRKPARPDHPDRWQLVLLVALLAAVLILAAVALAPPTDADSLAYHFARPKLILHDGRLTFIPRAVDGAAPLLVQLTYLPALALGGETAMTLWAMLSGLMPILAVGLVARRWLSSSWSLALVLALATTPGMLYGLGSGQAETRIVPFVFFAGLALAEGRGRKEARWSLLAGLLAGCFAAAKFFGLFFIAAAGLICLLQPGWLAAGLLFGLGALAAGSPVYVWNWLTTGDPVFPALFQALGLADSEIWTASLHRYFMDSYAGAEKPAPVTLGWFLAYPFKAALDGLPGWESLRTGLGPLALLLLPFALASLPPRLARLSSHPLSRLILVSALFYAFWFFLGASQRLRHLVPIYPCLLLALAVAAQRARRLQGPVLAAWSLTLVLQAAGLLLYARPAVAYLFSAESREDHVGRLVANVQPAFWANANLSGQDRLLYFERQLTYYLDVPYFYGAPAYQAQISLLPEDEDFAMRWRQMRGLGITHLLLIPGLDEDRTELPQNRTGQALLSAGCAETVVRLPVTLLRSRTLPGLGQTQGSADILRLTPKTCDPDRLRLANPAPTS